MSAIFLLAIACVIFSSILKDAKDENGNVDEKWRKIVRICIGVTIAVVIIMIIAGKFFPYQ